MFIRSTQDLLTLIRDIPDFPQKGVIFLDDMLATEQVAVLIDLLFLNQLTFRGKKVPSLIQF